LKARARHGGMANVTGSDTPAQPPGDDGAAGGGRKRGKKWSIAEQMSLMDAYAAVCFDAAIGAQQTADVFAARIEIEFLRSDRCPSRETFESLPSGEKSRWYGRGSKSCKTHADVIRSECVAFQGYVRRVEALELSGNPTEDGLFRCAVYLHNKRPVDRTVLYGIATADKDAPDAGS
jgi:hypothetical protein